jgi:hypothetical protein
MQAIVNRYKEILHIEYGLPSAHLGVIELHTCNWDELPESSQRAPRELPESSQRAPRELLESF